MRRIVFQVSCLLYRSCAILTTSLFSARAYFDSPRPPLPVPSTGPTRLSIAPRGLYNQPEREPRTITNADNYFRFAQNLRQGVPLNQQPPPRPAIIQQADSISQLANAMLLPRQLPQAHPEPEPEPLNFFQPLQPRFPNPLQPQKQQITPPFNLSK
jgi:ATP-dependent DNA helicase HFM1/MER3